MSMVVENGTGLSNSNSYVSEAEADAYVLLRLVPDWANLTVERKEASLVAATDYIEATYRQAFKGHRMGQTQALSWPREDAYVDGFEVARNIVPDGVKKAAIELAILHSQGVPLLPDSITRGIKREKVDVLEVEYQDGALPMAQFPLPSRLLQPYLEGSSSESGAMSLKVRRV